MDFDQLLTGVKNGDRRALARAITLVESRRADHRQMADRLLQEIGGSGRQALRIGLSGTPGVGKSTFIEAFGRMLTGQGLKVAVLAVDPSSSRSGGSILGDKTRMERLARDPNAFIRPSPSQTSLGGVARRTRDSVAVVEAAGFDVVLIETVGVGQSETMVSEMSDIFVLLIAPGGGDELQGVKRGIMEIADIILVNKADGEMIAEARRTAADYAGAFRLFRRRDGDPDGFPKVLTVSAIEAGGLGEAWDAMRALFEQRRDSGFIAARRAEQARDWFRDEVRAALMARIEDRPVAAETFDRLRAEVEAGARTPGGAAAEFVASLDKAEEAGPGG